jgi:hypothetical protein
MKIKVTLRGLRYWGSIPDRIFPLTHHVKIDFYAYRVSHVIDAVD